MIQDLHVRHREYSTARSFEEVITAFEAAVGTLEDTGVPSIVAASLEALKILTASNELPERLRKNTAFFRKKAAELGLQILPGEHPIVPVMVGDAAKAARMAEYLLQKGIYVIGFSYPVVPMGKARIRTQVSAAHTTDQLGWAAEMFAEAAAKVE